MKTILLLLMFFPSQPDTGLIITNDYVLLKINRQMPESELLAYKEILKEKKNIILDYQTLVYTRSGKIFEIAIKVSTPEGNSGSARIIFSNNKERFGFYSDPNDKKSPFGIGILPEQVIEKYRSE